MATIINQRSSQAVDPIRNFRFLVQFQPLVPNKKGFDPQPTIGFTSVSGLSISTESIPYREGGYNTTIHQIPGQSTFSPVTFQRGVTIGSKQNWDWMSMLFRTVTGAPGFTAKSASFRADVVINVLNHPIPFDESTTGVGFGGSAAENTVSAADLVVARFRLYNAWPTSVAYSDLNAGDNALMVEQMTLVHEGLDMEWAQVTDGVPVGI